MVTVFAYDADTQTLISRKSFRTKEEAQKHITGLRLDGSLEGREVEVEIMEMPEWTHIY